MPHYWGVRLGRGGEFVEQARKGGYIAVGWNEMGDLAPFADEETSVKKLRDEFDALYRNAFPKATTLQVGIDGGQLWKFLREIGKDDIVVVPHPVPRRVLLGRVTSAYKYQFDWKDRCAYQHRKEVEWLADISRDDLSVKLKHSLGSLLTIFRLDSYSGELAALISGRESDSGTKGAAVTGDALVAAARDRLFNLNATAFEVFVTHVLGLAGFEAVTTKPVATAGLTLLGLSTWKDLRRSHYVCK